MLTVDLSCGGFCFASSKHYAIGALVDVAVPYAPGGVNIFVPARIAWAREQSEKGVTLYGVAYIQVTKDSPRR